ncbi:MAG: PCMD domain-containing protein [Bacteroidetes bacterium]|nr:PCMD domain-containing protein [Bacteroidota bacterium]
MKNHLVQASMVMGIFLTACNFSLGQEQLKNPGFEKWEIIRNGIEEPIGWTSLKNSDGGYFMNRLAPDGLIRSTDAHNGTYSVKLINKSTMNVVATGTLTNGAIHPDFKPEKGYVYTNPNESNSYTPFTSRPDSLTGWFKFFPKENDKIMVWAILHTGQGSIPEFGTKANWIGEALFVSSPVTTDKWTRFSVPFTYYNNQRPQHILIILNSGYGIDAIDGSEALFDDIELIYNRK